MKLFSHAKEKRVLVFRKRWLLLPAALACICALCFLTNLPTYVSAYSADRQLPIYCVQRDYKVCALTFDAAWGNGIIRLLGRKGLIHSLSEVVLRFLL